MPEIPAEAVQAAAKASSMHFAFCDEPRWQDCAECVRVMERMERGLKAAAPSLAEQIAREIERVVASGEYLRPKYERGGFFNDARWSAKVAREAFTPVQGLVKECPQTATESTESAETPTSRVSVPPEGAEGITEPRGADARAVIALETRGAFEADPPEEHQPQSPPQSDLRRRYADALSRSLTSPQRGMADHLDAVLAVRDDELADAVRRAEQAEAKLAAAAELADQRAFPVSRGDGDGTGTWRYAVDAAELDRIIEHDPAGAGQPNAGPAGDSGGRRELLDAFTRESIELGTYDRPAPVTDFDLEHAARRRAEQAEAANTRFEDLLGTIWLHIGWTHVTRQLTTEQKELFADAIDNSRRRANRKNPAMGLVSVDRWWRDDAPADTSEEHPDA